MEEEKTKFHLAKPVAPATRVTKEGPPISLLHRRSTTPQRVRFQNQPEHRYNLRSRSRLSSQTQYSYRHRTVQYLTATPALAEAPDVAAEAQPDPVEIASPEPVIEEVVAEPEVAPVIEAPVAVEEPLEAPIETPAVEEDLRNVEPEVLRQRAAARRKAEDQARQQKLDEVVATREAD